MAKITVVYDKVGNCLDIWFKKPQKAVCEEVGHGVILKKDKKGEVIGFEKINFLPKGLAGQATISIGILQLLGRFNLNISCFRIDKQRHSMCITLPVCVDTN